ncbi:MAG: amidohydrolase family protein [Candidatus Doudnabacteria bacterium]|nr:amidohydrolase family protein [Candidatus Doudnabacteria bacterium]
MTQPKRKIAVDLHAHLGSSVAPSILWSIAHRQGIKLPVKDYWDFQEMITMDRNRKNNDLDDMHNNFFHWTELIQSSPEAIQESVKSVIGGGYRACNITVQELRFNPMFRNRGGERDLDHIITSAIWGMEQAILEYPQVKAGLILMVERLQSMDLGEIIFNKAIKYSKRGVIGVDIAGAEKKTFSMRAYKPIFNRVRKAGLGITIHTGEAGSLEELAYVVREIKPDRIGHGILCVKDKSIMKDIIKQGIILETCPTSNLKNNVVKDLKELKNIYRTLLKNKVKFTINTDGAEMYRTNILKEHELLLTNKILTQKEIDNCTKIALESTFIK